MITAELSCLGAPKNLSRSRKLPEFKVSYVTIKSFQTNNFKTIGEYFGDHKEHNYYRCVTRHEPSERAGTYFIVGLNRSVASLPKGTTIKISWVTDLKNDPSVVELPIPEHSNKLTSEIYCGVTSEFIPEISAWKVEFLDHRGKVLFSKKSLLWN